MSAQSFVVVDAEQRSDAWFTARCGRLTGSVAGDMLATVKSGESASRRNLRLRLVLERLTGRPQESGFVTPTMQTGIDREAAAFAAFEALTGLVAVRTGFLQHTTLMAGCSLDGHMGQFETLLSIKCRQPAAHLDFIRSGTIPASAMAQMRHELWITGANSHTYFSWNPDFPPPLQQSRRLVTIARTDAEIPAYEEAALAFLDGVDLEVLAIQEQANLDILPIQEQADGV